MNMSEASTEEKISNLTDLGNVIPEGYNYVRKKITPESQLNLPGACLKWYNLCLPNLEITNKQVQEAKTFLKLEAEGGRLKLDNELGFVVLHRAGEYLLLLVITWRNINEMWESIYLKKVEQKETYTSIKFENNHKGTYCVWELGAVWHERNAWVRFFESKRDEAAKREYMNDMFSGMI
jgi:hypothetical protein